MLSRIAALVVCVLALPIITVAQSDDPIPPPLAYAAYNNIEQGYYVLDFDSGSVTTVPTTTNPYTEFGGEQFMEHEITLRSPYEEGLGMQFIVKSGDIPEENQYDLYRLEGDQAMELVAVQTIPASPLNWSPNGRYFYFYVYQRSQDVSTGDYILYQYDLQPAGDIRPILRRVTTGVSCAPQTEWCVVRQWSEPHQFTTIQPYLLDTNTGDFMRLADATAYNGRVWWEQGRSAFFYSASPSETSSSLRLYDYQTHSDTLIAEFDERAIREVEWSPDERWLAVITESELYVIDALAEQPAPVLLTGEIDLSVTNNYFRWLSADTLFFDAQLDGEWSYGYYTATVQDGVVSTAELPTNGEVNDDDWSPDGRWLAVSFSDYGENNSAYVIDALGEVPVYELQVDFEPRDLICVDWYDAEQYQTDIRGLCDIYMGIG